MHNTDLTDIIIRVVNDNARTPENKKEAVASLVRGYGTDLLNLLGNIALTSAGESDRKQRIADMCSKFGITKSGNNFL